MKLGVLTVAVMALSSHAIAQQDLTQDWADIYARVAVLEAAYENCLRNSHWVGQPGVIPPVCRTGEDMKGAGFLPADYLVPTVCAVPPSGQTAWMFVHLQQCDRGTLCPVLISRFKEEQPKLGLGVAVEDVKQALAFNGLILSGDEQTVFARALAGEGTGVNVAEWICSLPRVEPPRAPAVH